MNHHAETIAAIYEAFGRGEGAREFFRVAGDLQVHDFRVLKMLAGEDSVAAEVVLELTAPNGARLRDEELHLWTLGDDGEVVRMRPYVDTAKHVAAAGA